MRGKKPYDRTKLTPVVRRLALAGKTVREIAAEANISRGMVYKIMKEEGDIRPPLSPKYMRHKLALAGAPLGSMAPAFDRQPLAFQRWLARQVAPGGTIADVVFAAALDQFHEETSADG